MFCVNCGSKFEGKFCPECGTPAGGAPSQMGQTNSSLGEVKELEYLRNARDFMLELANEYSRILEEDIKAVQVKKEANVHIEEKAALEAEVDRLTNECRVSIDRIENEANKKEISLGKAALGMMTYGLSLAATGIHKKKDLERIEENKLKIREQYDTKIKNKMYRIQELNVVLDNINNKFWEDYNASLDNIRDNVNRILTSDKWLEAKANIQPNYFNIDAIPKLIEYLSYGRARTWSEACALYEDEMFKMKMIDIGERQIAVQEDILESQQDLIDLSVESINLQKLSLELQKAGFEIQKQILESQETIAANTAVLVQEAFESNKAHKEMIKKMAKIRKDTKCTKNAARISAFIDTHDLFFGKKVSKIG